MPIMKRAPRGKKDLNIEKVFIRFVYNHHNHHQIKHKLNTILGGNDIACDEAP